MEQFEESSSDERGWADASTSTLPPDDYEGSALSLALLSPVSPLQPATSNTSCLDLEETEEPRERTSSVSTDELSDALTSQQSGTTEETLRRTESTVGRPRQPKKKNQKKKAANRNKGTQVDFKLIGTSWPKVKKNTTNDEPGEPSTSRRKPKSTRKPLENQDNSIQGSQDSLNQENAPEIFTSEENLSSSLTSQPDLTHSDSSSVENIANERNFPVWPEEHQIRLSVIPEEPSDIEESSLIGAQPQEQTHTINPPEQSIVPPVQPVAAAPTPVIAHFVINFSQSGSSAPGFIANCSIAGTSRRGDETTPPLGLKFPSNPSVNCISEPFAIAGASQRANSSFSSFTSDYVSTTSSLERSVSYESLPEAMPPKLSSECGEGTSKNADKKPAASLKPKPKVKDKKPKSKSSSKKTTKKKSRVSHSRRCCCSESDSYSDDSRSSYTTDSCSCSDCCSYSEYSSDSSYCRAPARSRKKKPTAAPAKKKRASKK